MTSFLVSTTRHLIVYNLLWHVFHFHSCFYKSALSHSSLSPLISASGVTCNVYIERNLSWVSGGALQRCSFISVGCGIVAWGCSIDVLHQLYVCFYLETISNPWGYAWKAAASFTLEVVAENSVVWWSEWLYSILKCCCPQLRVAGWGLTKNTVGIDILQNWNSKII